MEDMKLRRHFVVLKRVNRKNKATMLKEYKIIVTNEYGSREGSRLLLERLSKVALPKKRTLFKSSSVSPNLFLLVPNMLLSSRTFARHSKFPSSS